MSIKEGSKLNAIVPGSALKAIIPASFDDAVRMARLAVNAGLYQSAKKRWNGENLTKEEKAAQHQEEQRAAEAQATMAILKGMEIGIPPLQALEVISIINGRSVVWGDGIPAILWSKGFEIDEEYENEGDDRKITAVCTVTRPSGKKITRKFGVHDAIKAGLWDERPKVKRKVWENKSQVWKDVDNDSPWFLYGKRMLSMRARGWCARDGAADALRGLYMREEMEDAIRAENARDITLERSPMMPTHEFLEPPPAPDEEPQESPEIEKQEAPSADDEFLSDLDVNLSSCACEDQLHEVWAENMETICSFGSERRGRADMIFERHAVRVTGRKNLFGG